MDTLNLLKTEGKFEFDVTRRISVVSQFVVIMKAVVGFTEAQCLVPPHPGLLPVAEPAELCARLDKELHLHLLEFAHAEDELPCHYLIPEGLANLRYTEGKAHTPCLLYIQEVHEDALGSLRPQEDLHGTVGGRAYLSGEHQVELPHFRPVTGA